MKHDSDESMAELIAAWDRYASSGAKATPHLPPRSPLPPERQALADKAYAAMLSAVEPPPVHPDHDALVELSWMLMRAPKIPGYRM
jgi:hypothetical protein